MDIVGRLKQYMEHYNLASSQFADAASIPRPTLSQLLNGRNKTNEGAKKVSSDILRKIHEAYPRLNIMWLLFGDGDMEDERNIEISEAQRNGNQRLSKQDNTENQDIQHHIDFESAVSQNQVEKNSVAFEDASIHRVADHMHASDIELMRESRKSAAPLAIQPDNSKKIQSIMVFYTDNSFEIFKPSE